MQQIARGVQSEPEISRTAVDHRHQMSTESAGGTTNQRGDNQVSPAY